jgi:ribonuclease-3
MRALVVGNSTLATIAVQYRLPERLRLHIAQSVTLKASTHVQADVFESYVGGLYKDQGLAGTKAWLDKLFTPYVLEAYRIVREQHGLPPLGGVNNELQAVTGTPPTPPPESRIDRMATTTLGHLGLFNQRLQQLNKSIEWVFDDTVTESNRATPVWAARALIDGAYWGYGRGNTKKAAKNEAAKQGLRRMGFAEDY